MGTNAITAVEPPGALALVWRALRESESGDASDVRRSMDRYYSCVSPLRALVASGWASRVYDVDACGRLSVTYLPHDEPEPVPDLWLVDPGWRPGRRIREIARRDGWWCSYCLVVLNGSSGGGEYGPPLPTVDHLIPTSRGGDDTLENSVLACVSCNSRKGARTLVEFVAAGL